MHFADEGKVTRNQNNHTECSKKKKKQRGEKRIVWLSEIESIKMVQSAPNRNYIQ